MPSDKVIRAEARLKDFISKNLHKIKEDIKSFGHASKNEFSTAAKASQKFGLEIKRSVVDVLKRFGPAALLVAGVTKAMQGLGRAMDFVKERTTGFEQSLSRIKAILRPTTEEFQSLSNKARDLGESTVFTASQASEAFVEMGKLGQNANQIIASSEGVLNLAALSQVGLSEAAKTTISTLNQFQLSSSEANRVVDIMAKSFNTSALDINKFSEAMKMSGAVAGNTNVPIEEMTGALAVLADNSIDASLAGTAMRKILLELADSSSPASVAIKNMAPGATTLSEKFKALQKSGMGATRITDMFGRIATTAAQILINNADSVDKLTKSYSDATGTAEVFAETALDNVAGRTDLLESAQESLAIAIGSAFGKDKKERLELYATLIRRATDIAKAHRGELETLSSVISWVFKTIANLGMGAIKLVTELANVFNMLYYGAIEKVLQGFQKLFQLINWGSEKILKKQAIDLSYINTLVEEFGTASQESANKAYATFFNLPFEETRQEIKNMNEEIEKTNELTGGGESLLEAKERKMELLRKEVETVKRLTEKNEELMKVEKRKLQEANKIVTQILQNKKREFEILSSYAVGLGQALASGIGKGTEGLKESFKNTLHVLLTFIEKQLLIAKVKAGIDAMIQGGLFNPAAVAVAIAKIAAITALFSAAKAGVASFGRGGEFVTNGRRLIEVGDNPGGRERVSITPLSSQNLNNSSSNNIRGGDINITVNGQASQREIRAIGDVVRREQKRSLEKLFRNTNIRSRLQLS